MNYIDKLARKITFKNSIQTFFIIRLLSDMHLVNDAFKAYAYFRWMDDVVDNWTGNTEAKLYFVARQKKIINYAFKNLYLKTKYPEENLVINLIKNHPQRNTLLYSYIRNFSSIIEFDAKRKFKVINQRQLNWYSSRIGMAVTDCISFFIGNSSPPPENELQYKAAIAAHIVHMLRDCKDDLALGFINISKEFLANNNLVIKNLEDVDLKTWQEEKCRQARRYFAEGKKYIKKVPVFRRKIAAALYCLRFEPLLTRIEKSLSR